MSIDFLYSRAGGRMLMKILHAIGAFRIASFFLRLRISKLMIPGYIKKNGIEMEDYEGQSYRSFAEFFARNKTIRKTETEPDVLISPCDGMLSVYSIDSDTIIPMKGSYYRVSDLVHYMSIADRFRDGVCLVFRLQACDYHHFCCFDDAIISETYYISGKLHSVQPIACEKYPVFRLNRRWCSIVETSHFGTAVQIEVGAMMVGGVRLCPEGEYLEKGDEMGNFELAGSTVILLLDSSIRSKLDFLDAFAYLENKGIEVPVKFGQEIGGLK